MAGRVMELALKIKGQLEASFPETMRQALMKAKALENKYGALNEKLKQAQKVANASGGNRYLQEQAQLVEKLGNLKNLQKQSEEYASMKKAQGENNQKYAETKAKVKELGSQYQQSQQVMAALRSRQQEVKITMEQSQKATNKYKTELAGLKAIRAKMETEAEAGGKSKKDLKQDSQYQQIQSQIKQTNAALQQSKSETKSAETAYKSLSQAVKQGESDLQRIGNAFNKAKTDAKGLGTSIRSQLSTMRQLQTSLNEAGYSTANFGASQLKLRTEVAQATAAMERQAAAQARLQQARQNQSQASFNLSNAQANFGGAIATAQSVMSPFVGAIESAASFEKGMSKVKAITNASDADMAKLTAQAKELGATTQFTARQAADGMMYLGLAGWKTENIIKAMPGLLNLAAAGDLDLARTADIVSDGMTAFHISASDTVKTVNGEVDAATHFADVLAATSSNANTDVNMIGDAFKYVGAVAGAAGYSIEDSALAMGVMANSGIKASMAGTALRSIMNRLVNPPKQAAVQLAKFGWSAKNADGTLKPFKQQMVELREKFKGLSQAEQVAAAKMIAGAEAAAGLSALMTSSDADFNKLDSAILNADGSAAKMAATMTANFKGAMNRVKSAVESVQISIGEAFLPTLTRLGDGLAENIGTLGQWAAQHKGIVIAVAGTAAAFSIFTVAIAGFGVVAAAYSYGMTSIGLATEALGFKFQAVSARITVFRAQMAANYAMLNGLSLAGMQSSFVSAMTSMKAAMLGVAASANAMKLRVVSAFTSISATSLLSSASAAIRGFGAAMLTAGQSALSLTLSMLPTIAIAAAIGVAAYLIYSNWSVIAPFFQMLWSTVSGAFQQAWTIIQPAIAQIGGAVSTLSTSIGNSQSLISAFVGGFAALLTGITGILATIIITAANFVSMLIKIFGGITTFITGALAGDWSTAWKGLCDIGTALLEGFVDTVKSLFGGIGETIGNVVDMMKGVFGGDIKTVIDTKNVHSTGANMRGLREVQTTPQPSAATQQLMEEQAAAAQEHSAALKESTQAAQENAEAQRKMAEETAAKAYDDIDDKDNVEDMVTTIQSTTESLQQGTEMQQQLTTAIDGSNQSLTQHTEQLSNNATSLSTFNEALLATNGNLGLLRDNSGTAAGNVQNLGGAAQAAVTALQSAATAIASIKITAPSVSAAPVAANYMGGIYPKGQFLSWIAERGPESIIPIDGSQRAIELWQQTGAMLGVYNGEVSPTFETTPTMQEQAKELDSLKTNQINNSSTVRDTKIEKQREIIEQKYQKLMLLQRKIVSKQLQNELFSSVLSEASKITAEPLLQTIMTDNLGNLKNYQGSVENLVQYGDLSPIREAKIAKQKEFLQTQLEKLEVEQIKQDKVTKISEPVQSLRSINSQDIFDVAQYGDLSRLSSENTLAQQMSIAENLPSIEEMEIAQSQADKISSIASNAESEENAMPFVVEPPINEGGEISIEYNAPTININGGIDESVLNQIKAILDESQKNFEIRVQRVIHESEIRERRLNYA